MKSQKLISAILIVVLLVSLCACGQKSASTPAAVTDPAHVEATTKPNESDDPIISAPQENPEPTNELKTQEPSTNPIPQVIATYDFEVISPFSQGLAWVSYDDNSGNERVGLVDENGTLIYIAREGARADGFIGNVSVHYNLENGTTKDVTRHEVPASRFLEDGFAYYSSDSEDVVVDKNGQEHLVTSKKEEESISICGHGDGLFILKKQVKTFSENSIYVAIADADGNMVFPYKKIEEDISIGHFIYVGEGIFRCEDGSIRGHGCFLNANTGAIFREISYSDRFLTTFIDGKAYFGATYQTGKYSAERVRATIVTPEVFENEESYNAWSSSLTAADAVELAKPTLNFPESVEIKEYGSFDGDFAPVLLNGADGSYYFTIVDESGNRQYEPKKLSNIYGHYTALYEDGEYASESGIAIAGILYSQGRIVFRDDENVYLVDKLGNIKRINVEYSSILGFKENFIYTRRWKGVGVSGGFYNLLTDTYTDKVSAYDNLGIIESQRNSGVETAVERNYINLSGFSIEGKWKNVGSSTYGQMQSGAIVAFDGTHCNVVSPQDTYAFYKNGDNWRLDCTTLLGETLSFTVKTVDSDHIDIYFGAGYLELSRIN